MSRRPPRRAGATRPARRAWGREIDVYWTDFGALTREVEILSFNGRLAQVRVVAGQHDRGGGWRAAYGDGEVVIVPTDSLRDPHKRRVG